MDYLGISELEKQSLGDFYILKLSDFEANILELKEAFENHYRNFKIGYSYKTNYIPRVCKTANELGVYAEIVSELELNIAKKIGVLPSNIIYNGPIKTEESLEFCLLNESKVNIDNVSELLLIEEIIKKYPQKNFSIGLRLNLNLGDNFFSRFGLDPESEELRQVFRIIAKHDNLKIVGLHTHSTRPAKNPNIFYNKLVSLIEFAKDCKLIEHLDYIDIGGGFYGKMDENIRAQFDDIIPTYNDYGTLLGKTMKKYFPDEEVQLIIEPGVAVTVNILDYFVKIIDIKKIKTKYIALSSGTFYNIKPSGHKKNLSIEIYSRTKTTIQHNKNQYDIVGYTCLENDYLYSGYNGTLNVGDYCRFKNVGAYTIVFKPPFIKLAPPIFLLDNEKNETVREIENFEDTFKPYCFR